MWHKLSHYCQIAPDMPGNHDSQRDTTYHNKINDSLKCIKRHEQTQTS